MKQLAPHSIALLIGNAVVATSAFAAPLTVELHSVSPTGVGESVGTVAIAETAKGASLSLKLKGIPPGQHGFHLHQRADCSPAPKDGMPAAAEAAGGHFDQDKTGHHAGPHGAGHVGDLPLVTAKADGSVEQTIETEKLMLADFSGKSLVLHAGGDNYSDTPKPLGGGGARIACGAIE